MNMSRANDYIVKKGDTLTSILYEKNLRPVYGKDGTLAETLKLNPKIKLSGGNKIFPNMKIVLANIKDSTRILSTVDSRQSTGLSTHQPRDSLRRCPG